MPAGVQTCARTGTCSADSSRVTFRPAAASTPIERAPLPPLVISDLHLGGEPGPGGAPGFRICTDVGERKLAEFLGWAAGLAAARDVHLVVNGDVVDFLAEKEFSPFTMDDDQARAKLRRILDRTAPVWSGFRDLLKAGGRLTLLLGNHDIELSLPGPRRMLSEELGDGRFEFLYDNQALTIGPVLIEHGNRYDSWNVVRDHVPAVVAVAVLDEHGPDRQRLIVVEELEPSVAQLLSSIGADPEGSARCHDCRSSVRRPPASADP